MKRSSAWSSAGLGLVIASAIGEARADEPIEEVRIIGAKEVEGPIVVSMSKAEVRQLPGAFGDPYRAIDVLPGVTPTVSGLPYYYIRGAPPSNVGYYVDGVRVPYLFHFGLGPGVLQPAIVERVDLYPGALPGRFGGAAGAIVAGETSSPKDKAWAEGQIRLIDAGAIAEVPFADGRAHVLLGGRYSYTAAVISLFAPETTINYRDYNARFTYDLTKRDRLTLFSFGAFDYASEVKKSTGRENVLFASEFHRADLRWDRTWSDATRTRVAFQAGIDRTRLEGARFTRNHPIGLRAEGTSRISEALTLRAGAHGLFEFYDADLPSPYAVSEEDYASTERLFGPRTDVWTGAYVEALFSLPRGIEIQPSLRSDLFASRGNTAFTVDPRLSARVPLGNRFRLLTSHGTATQPPAFPVPVPALQISGLRGGIQRVYQTTVGAEVDLPESMLATATLFRNAFRNVGDLFSVVGTSFNTFEDETRGLNGVAYGAELMLRRKFARRISGIASYTFSRNERVLRSGSVPNGFDRPHVANLALSFDLGRGYRVGARALYFSGSPRMEENVRDLGGVPRAQPPDRLPNFFRLDARAEKRWTFSGGWTAFVIEVLNATLSKQSLGYDCDNQRCEPEEFGPITVPSIGFEGGF